MINPIPSLSNLIDLSPHTATSNDDWTWGEAGEQALYGVISVFVILILLTLLTWAAGKLVPRIEKGRTATDGKKH